MEIANERRHLAIVAEPHDAIVRRLRENEADPGKPERIIGAAQALHNDLRARASLDDAGNIRCGIKDDGARSDLRVYR